jgi:hypothetical protein
MHEFQLTDQPVKWPKSQSYEQATNQLTEFK